MKSAANMVDDRYRLILFYFRSPGDLDHSMSMEDIAPFDLTPQAEFVSMDMTERKMLTQVHLKMGLVARKPVFGSLAKASFKPVSSATETS